MALGVAAAHPDRRVVLFCGDAGFMMAAQNLDAASINGLSLTVVVMNDAQYGSEIKPLRQLGLPLDVIKQPMPDVRRLADAFGGRGYVFKIQSELEAFELPSTGLTLIEARVDPEVNVREALR
jgi:acetolactate synthase-1/2/3 large subunit